MSCIDNLLGVKDPCSSSQVGEGIFDVTDAVGFSWNRASSLGQGNGLPISGYDTIVRLRNMAYKEVMIDLMQELSNLGFIDSLSEINYTSGEIKNNNLPSSNAPKGIQITTVDSSCKFKGAKLKQIRVYSHNSVEIVLRIQVNGLQVKTLTLFVIGGVPYVVDDNALNDLASFNGIMTIYTTTPTFEPMEVTPSCGCGGRATNKCAKSSGYINQGGAVVLNNNLAYGIIAELSCACDYDSIFCSLPNKNSLARLVLNNFEKSLCELALNVDKYSYYTIYDRETIKENYNKKLGEYKSHLTQYIKSNQSYLAQNQKLFCGCITCNGSTLKSLI